MEAVGFSSVLPGSDALQLAMFVGHAAGGVPGALTALFGSILPPTLLMLGVVAVHYHYPIADQVETHWQELLETDIPQAHHVRTLLEQARSQEAG
ncbi:MAG: chromate transporter [Anaerolineae bacterium]|nr:chromate transporter [Anaerolineae bacterium]